MDRHGIGTDATVSEHISKMKERAYATRDEHTMQFWPTPLGEALISAFCRMGLEDLWRPQQRGVSPQNKPTAAALDLGEPPC